MTAESLATLAAAAGQVPREHPERPAPGRAPPQPAGGRRRLPPGPAGLGRSRWPTSSARSTGHWPRCGGCGPRRPATRVRPSTCRTVWVAVRASLRSVLEQVTIADIMAGDPPKSVVQADHRPGRLDSPTEAAGPPGAVRRRRPGAAPYAAHMDPRDPAPTDPRGGRAGDAKRAGLARPHPRLPGPVHGGARHLHRQRGAAVHPEGAWASAWPTSSGWSPPTP